MQTKYKIWSLIGHARLPLFLVLLVPLTGAVSCQSNQPSRTTAAEGRALFGTSSPDPASNFWSIVIVSYTAKDSSIHNQAQLDLLRVHEVGLRQAYVEMRGERLVLALGRYDGPDDPAALADLERVKQIEWSGIKPFAGAILAPPANLNIGNFPEFNLANAMQRFGKNAIYSLQIGIYGRADRTKPSETDLKQFRKAAEEGAAQLRREGELAFYYHGTNTSSITVGVFGHADYRIEFDADGRKDTIRSGRLDALVARFPFLLLNGKTIRLTALSQGGTEVLQRTDLIGIP